MINLNTIDLNLFFKNKNILKGINLEIRSGELVSLVGPNGAGKSSLMKTLVGIQKISSGQINLNGRNIKYYSEKEKATQIAYLPQIRTVDWSTSVYDLIKLGRFAHNKYLSNLTITDKNAINHSIEICNIEHLVNRNIHTLSGGEITLVHCARAFSTESPLLLADEIVSSLDPFHEIKIMNVIKNFVRNGRAALVILHDLNLAASYSDRIIWMKSGEILANDTPYNSLNSKLIKDIYNVESTVSDLNVKIKRSI